MLSEKNTPSDIIFHITDFLFLSEMPAVFLTSHALNDRFNKSDQTYWKRKLITEFPFYYERLKAGRSNHDKSKDVEINYKNSYRKIYFDSYSHLISLSPPNAMEAKTIHLFTYIKNKAENNFWDYFCKKNQIFKEVVACLDGATDYQYRTLYDWICIKGLSGIKSKLYKLAQNEYSKLGDDYAINPELKHPENWDKHWVHFLARRGFFDELFSLISKNPALIHVVDFEGNTVLHYAGFSGQLEITKFLLKNGAVVNVEATQKGTPLHGASRYGHPEVVDYLLEEGAGLNAKDEDGDTPLHEASRDGRLDVVKLLIEKGAALDVQNDHGDTPLHEASFYDHPDIVEFLLEKGAALDVANSEGETPLAHAQGKNQSVCVFLRYYIGRVEQSNVSQYHGESSLFCSFHVARDLAAARCLVKVLSGNAELLALEQHKDALSQGELGEIYQVSGIAEKLKNKKHDMADHDLDEAQPHKRTRYC